MPRRDFLAALAAGAWLAAGCAAPDDPAAGGRSVGPSTPDLVAHARSTRPVVAPLGVVPPTSARLPLPHGTLTALPGHGRNLALTVDDGANSHVVGAYIRFARDTGARFTFFVTGSYESWTDHRRELRPLVESGQIQLGNHTWDHPDLTSLTPSGVAHQLRRTRDFLKNEFGVDGAPYYRPPYGFHDARVDAVAADLGYTVPTLWYGSLSDSGLITEQYLLKCARQYFHAQAIVIGHANHPPVTHVYPQLAEIIRSRGLSMVTLNDVFEPPRPAMPH
ncbi:polysaccharide deacetylase family protein [Gordonia aichiensis]|uniref:polysaccharide deacetylase family protein n=2 Tax=Gordonia TaxID=2053 RepID=UPI0032641D46